MDDYQKLTAGEHIQLALGLQIDALDDGDSQVTFTQQEKERRSEAARMAFESGVQPEWYEEYRQLVDKGIPWRIVVFVLWASMAKSKRIPKTQQELAINVLGLTSDRVISEWRKKSPEIDEWITIAQVSTFSRHRADINDALVESAMRPVKDGAQDRRLFYQLTGDLVEKKEIDFKGSIKDDDLSGMSKEQLLAMRDKKKKEVGKSAADSSIASADEDDL